MNIVTFGPVESGNGVWFSGLLTLIVGIIWLGVGGALFSLQPWGLLFVEIMAIFALIEAVFVLFWGASQNTGMGPVRPAAGRALVRQPAEHQGSLRPGRSHDRGLTLIVASGAHLAVRAALLFPGVR